MNLTIEKVIYGGNGLARLNDQAVFVPFTLPGEVVEATDAGVKDGVATAQLEAVLQPSDDRVAAACDHFTACGGCHLQQASYKAQLTIKRGILRETLERAGVSDLPAIATLSAEPWGYRNRIRLRIAKHDGALRVGYLRRGTLEFLPVHMCPIAAPLLWRAAESLLTLNENPWIQDAEEVELFANDDLTKLQLMLFLSRQPKGSFNSFCESLQQQLPELIGAGVSIMEGASRGRKTQRFRPGPSWGATGMNYHVANESYWVSRGGFFQVNRSLLSDLVHLVTHSRSGSLAWDLYAGVGLFSRVLAKNFSAVVAVEAAAEDLQRSFRGNGRRAIEATTVEFLRRAVLERDRPDLIVLDPPRAGAGAEVCSLLARMRTPEIVYVSCDPITLGRDLKLMVDSGYRLCALHLVDMFPQTYHQETVAVLRYTAT
ncbi:MAG: 23S rRNA (uracil(1939)-C(5))-methyltransferase RlmD [Edaphobacter sp.]|uniref:23S rRNA (uracil(1939)-C(5))-methyltransferase RlmD n=1 Tax=Edaphobacter sp. TaxID=1934404 RepID=UPI00238FADF5|nr:23S rRNA (uracil(1939)-C(5))-methyltransferase RlmD [Edaphobacter sp.]MDE1176583.1 23S rRNA (uracil(1939)-C(5))-methyltransferase RlmD [Edaphobacter sp.]